ncbi:DUF4136 domain-containing protein [Devosia sp. Root436]|uniref:DUF4136 domain-containing protein n=1 Tax=Devosia sp. Root436 TaxID=1736537 RepID=UPI000A4E3E0B|nr:DUF4136 domain-containing protein [Devosia sp. Root436]
MTKFAILAVAFLSVGLAACQSVQSNVTAFHTLQPNTPETFSVRASNIQGDSLEATTYAGLISTRLEQHGWSASSSPDVDVRFAYAIDGGRTSISSVPIYGQTGGGTTYSTGNIYGTGGFGSYSGTSYTPTTYGVVGVAPVSHTTYQRVLSVEMTNTKTGKKIYEAKVVSSGSSGTFAEVASCLIDALFEDFPGTSGKARAVEVSMSDCGA